MNQYGYFGAALKQEVQPNTFFTISGTFELQALRKTPRIGVALEHNSWMLPDLVVGIKFFFLVGLQKES